MKIYTNRKSAKPAYKPASRVAKNLVATSAIVSMSLFNVVFADQSQRDTRFFNDVPTVDQIAEQLFPVRTRSIVINKPSATSSTRPQRHEKSVGLPVLFHFGKTALVEASKPYLDSVGKFMTKPEYAKVTLVIEGHTDTVGSRGYNQRLSELRALAVKDYLMNRHGIESMRLFPAGKGESQLYDQANPKSGKNRRVEFLRYGAN